MGIREPVAKPSNQLSRLDARHAKLAHGQASEHSGTVTAFPASDEHSTLIAHVTDDSVSCTSNARTGRRVWRWLVWPVAERYVHHDVAGQIGLVLASGEHDHVERDLDARWRSAALREPGAFG